MYLIDLPLDEILQFPTPLTYHNVNDVTLVLAPESANWVTLTTQELQFFQFLVEGLTPREASIIIDTVPNSPELSQVAQRTLTRLAVRQFFAHALVEEQRQKNVAHLYLTNLCNLNCNHCYMHSGLPEPGQVSVYEFMQFLDNFAFFGGTHVNLSGGEPLLYGGFWEVLDRARQVDLKSYILTNGTMLTRDIAVRLAESAFQVQVSIDGPEEASHDAIRGRGTFARTIDGLMHLRELDVAVRVAMIVTPQTISSYERVFVPFARRLLDEFGEQLQLRVSVDTASGRNVQRLASDEVQTLQQRMDALFDSLWGYNTRSHTDLYFFKRRLRNRNCGFGREISIRSNGDVYPCPIQIHPIGNIRRDDVSKLVSLSAVEGVAKGIDCFDKCRNCDLKYICGGGCRAANFEITGLYNYPAFCDSKYLDWILRRLCDADQLYDSTIDVNSYIPHG